MLGVCPVLSTSSPALLLIGERGLFTTVSLAHGLPGCVQLLAQGTRSRTRTLQMTQGHNPIKAFRDTISR